MYLYTSKRPYAKLNIMFELVVAWTYKFYWFSHWPAVYFNYNSFSSSAVESLKTNCIYIYISISISDTGIQYLFKKVFWTLGLQTAVIIRGW